MLCCAAFRTTELAAGKNAFRCLALVAAASPAIYQALRSPHGDLDMALASLWPSISAVGVIAFVYSALGPGALSSILQTYGQRTVSAPVAQVLYAIHGSPLMLLAPMRSSTARLPAC